MYLEVYTQYPLYLEVYSILCLANVQYTVYLQASSLAQICLETLYRTINGRHSGTGGWDAH